MRDIALLVFFLACVPFMLKRPAFGMIMWVWLSVMNPHRLAYGFAYNLQFAAATAVITLVALLLAKGDKRLPLTPPVIALGLFMFWICLTSLFPFHPDSGFDMWSRVMKIFLMTMVGFMIIRQKQEIHWLVWIIVISLGFYGAKGGAFTVLTGGNYLVWGPEGSFIEGNNEIALALVMTIPLMRYVQLGFKKPWQKHGMTAVMGLSAFAAIGSHSRGALLALAAMAVVMWWKSRNKFIMGIMLAIVAIALVMFMPESWMTRMQTIETYDEDASALGRINAWWMAFNLARDRFLGGGFEIYDFDVFAKYAPNPLDVHAAHSIYFQVMAEHGFVGLFLFLCIGVTTWMAASDAKRKAKGIVDLVWVGQLVDMLKVSMVGYAVGGAFLSLAYYDVPYYITIIAVATRALVVARRKTVGESQGVGRPARSDFFGVVPIDDDAEGGPVEPVRRPRGSWRGQGGYGKPALLNSAGTVKR